MRSLVAMLTLVATLVVVGLPCVARTCVPQAAAERTLTWGVAVPATGSTHEQTPPCTPVPMPHSAPTSPADDEEPSTSIGDGGDHEALPVALDDRIGEFQTSGRRIVVPALSAPATRASETSPRPPRI